MGTIYIVLILICRVFQHLYNKKVSNSTFGIHGLIKINGIRQCIAAFMAFLLIVIFNNRAEIDLMTVIISAFSGTMIVISMSCSLYAMKTGMISLVSLFGTAGLIIPCLVGVFLFDTSVSPMQWLGFAIFMVSAYLMIMSSKDSVKGFSVKTFFLLLGVMLSEGFTMMAQQMFTQYVPDGDVSVFSFLSFGIVGVIMLSVLPFIRKNDTEKRKPTEKKTYLYAAILATTLLIINQLATLATAIVPPIILFTFINGGSTVIAAIVAMLVYKEKLTVKSVFGIALGIISFIIIKAFQ